MKGSIRKAYDLSGNFICSTLNYVETINQNLNKKIFVAFLIRTIKLLKLF